MSYYSKLKLLGTGSFSSVYLVKNELDGEKYVMKEIKVAKSFFKDIKNELKVIKKISKSDVDHLKFIESFYSADKSIFNIIIEYLPGSKTLRELIFDHVHYMYYFTCQNISFIMKSLINQLYWMHSHGILHGDIKPENILIQLDEKENITKCVFIDFGLSCTRDCVPRGTLLYMAPEVLPIINAPVASLKKHKVLNPNVPLTLSDFKKTDIFSLGLVFYEVLNLSRPFFNTSTSLISENLMYNINSDIGDNYNEDSIKDLASPNIMDNIFTLTQFYKKAGKILSISPLEDFGSKECIFPYNTIVNNMLIIDPVERANIKKLKNLVN